MSFSPQLFLTNLNAKEGLAKSSRFEVILPIPAYINKNIQNSFIEKVLNLPNTIISDVTDLLTNTDSDSKTNNTAITRYLALQCESAELPGKSLITSDVKIYGPTYKIPYQTQYQETSLNFLCTNEFYERKLFESWMECIMPTDTHNLRYAKENSTRYLTNIKIIQYDEFIRQIFAIELVDAFPISIASQPLSWSEEGFHRLSIQFSYQKYKVLYKGEFNLAQAALTLFGTKFARFLDNKTKNLYDPFGTIFGAVT